MALQIHALTDYATVSAYPGLTTIAQPLCEQFINVASKNIAKFCNRTLHYCTYTIANPDKCRGFRSSKLRLSTHPIALGGTINTPPPDIFHGCVTQVSLLNWPESSTGPYIVPQQEYEFDGQDGAEAGRLYSAYMFPSTGLMQPGMNFEYLADPGSEEATTWVAYSGGYITKPQCYGGAGGQTWTYPGINTLVALGTLLLTGTSPNQILWQSVPNGLGLVNGDASDATGSSMPSFPASPTIGQTQSDGTVLWMALGKAGAAGFAVTGSVLNDGSTMVGGGRITLPDELEQACIEEVKSMFRGAGRDSNVKSQSLMGTSVTYRDITKSGLCPAAEALAMAHKDVY